MCHSLGLHSGQAHENICLRLRLMQIRRVLLSELGYNIEYALHSDLWDALVSIGCATMQAASNHCSRVGPSRSGVLKITMFP